MVNPINLSIPGPGPYGFRLTGGDSVPLAVAKLRGKSKASELGLREGDVILGINGRSCQSVSHADAVKLLTSSNEQLELYIARDISGPFDLSEAFQKLHSVLRPLSPQQQQDLTSKPTNEASSSFSCYIHTTPVQGSVTSNYLNSRPTTSTEFTADTDPAEPFAEPQFIAENIEREKTKQQFLQQAKQQSFFEIQLQPQDLQRKFSLGQQETLVYRHVPNAPQQNTVADVIERPRKSLDSGRVRYEQGLNGPKSSRGGTTAVSLSWQEASGDTNEDHSQVIPQLPCIIPYGSLMANDVSANFRVSQISATPWIWKPGHEFHVSSKPVEEYRVNKVSLSGALLDELIAKHSPNQKGQNEDDEESDIKRLHLIKILTSLDEDALHNISKRKIFADSSFYDDPDHTYPTIEEQIKMARKVALSLTAPGNITARGHRMFMKRKERSQYWNIDNPAYRQESSRENPYYNPTPWLSCGTKKHDTANKSENSSEIENGFPNKSLKNRFPRKFDRHDGKSKENVSPKSRVNFNLSDELVNNKSKAGQLFQKRRAKSEEPVEHLVTQKYDRSHFSLLRPLQKWSETLEPEEDGPKVACRLKDMIQEYEIRKSPYYTGIGLGNIDFSEDILSDKNFKGWKKPTSTKIDSQDEGRRSEWFVRSSRRNYGPVGQKSSRKFGSTPSLNKSFLVGPVTDF